MRVDFDISGGYTTLVEVGSDIQVAFYPGGDVGVRHMCNRSVRPRDGRTGIVAPRLQLDGGHRIESTNPITISPSVACSDCGLHGFIRNGTWESC